MFHDRFLNWALPVTGKLKLSKMPLKNKLYLYQALTEDYSSVLNNRSIAACISVMLGSIVRQGELFPGETVLIKIHVSISAPLNIAVSVK